MAKESAKLALGKLEARLAQNKKDQEAEYDERKQEQAESYTRLTDQLSGFRKKLDEARLDIVNDRLSHLQTKVDTAITARTEADTKVTALGTRLQALEEAGKSPAAGVDNAGIRTIANDVFAGRVGEIAYTKTVADKLVADTETKVAAAVDAMKSEATVAVETVKKDAAVAVAETKTETASALSNLAQWRVEEERRIADGVDAVGILVEEGKILKEQAAYENQIWNIARRETGLNSVDAKQIQGAANRLDTEENNLRIRDAMSDAIQARWANSRKSQAALFARTDLHKSPLAQDPRPPGTRRRSVSPGPTPALATGASFGATRPASHSTTPAPKGTHAMFFSRIDESPYTFADD